MSYITPNWSVPSHVRAVSTTRIGGVSDGQYGSMNLGLHVGDKPEHVVKNREKLRSQLNLPNEPVWLEQVHGNKVIDANSPISEPVDGSFSSKDHTVCAVMTADCLPLLLCNREGSRVAAIHVGWRGMASGIIENAVAQFNEPKSDVVAWAGPCIGATQFEVGAEVRDQLGGPGSAYIDIKNNKLLVDLHLLCQQRLSAVGVDDYSSCDACTYSDSVRFFSYRRDGQCGRMASLIWIDRSL